MNVRDTSLEAYQNIQPNLGHMQWQVFETIRDLGAANDKIIALKLGWEINRVTPRRNELEKAGLIEEDSTRPDPKTKVSTIFWRVKK